MMSRQAEMLQQRADETDGAFLLRLAEECRRLAATCDERDLGAELLKLSADIEAVALHEAAR